MKLRLDSITVAALNLITSRTVCQARVGVRVTVSYKSHCVSGQV